jgi:tetratricopeptide (TPR) repeat protein
MYRFEASKEYYQRSIESALEDGRSYFASVAYYNLSLLQKAFYRFNGAMQSTNRSLSQAQRATGHLAKGELYEMQMDFRRAHDQYTEAYNLDEETPLAKLDLAALYRSFGRLDEALAYARDVYGSDDLHWLFNFGTDERRHRMEMHDLLSTIYRGKARVLGLTPAGGPLEWLSNTAERLRYRVLAWYHDVTFRRFAADVAEAYEEEGSTLNAHWTYFRAHERYPELGLRHLSRARELETEVIPESEPFYAMRAGALRGDTAGIARAVDAMHPRWERSSIAVGLREIALTARRSGDSARAARAAVELYRINPGGLRQHGLRLPVALSVSGADPRRARRLIGMLERAGFAPARNAVADAAPEGTVSPLRLEIEILDDARAAYRLLDEDRFVGADTLTVGKLDRAGTARLARAVAEGVFQVE